MSTLLKDSYNETYLKQIAAHICVHLSDFKTSEFLDYCLSKEWDDLSLKERMKKISCALNSVMPGTFKSKAKVLTKVSAHFSSYPACVFPDFIEQFGLNDLSLSIKCLEEMTRYSTSEFAVRPFIEKYPSQMLAQALIWAHDKNEHVRRLASEGYRPRLPWGKALITFKRDPTKLLKLLNVLKNDPSEYVRRSVANNLNDIGKDHPQLLKNFVLLNYTKVSSDCDKMLKHASRNLLKSGDEEILKIFSYPLPQHIAVDDFKLSESVDWNGSLEFSFSLSSKEQALGLIRIEYEIMHLKANASYSTKVFKISEVLDKNSEKKISKKHSFQKRSVRKYYPGKHYISIKINGIKFLTESFKLLPKT
ncbi:DNA alkylation repair protein [Lentisphaera profundi]|uniref:DNA alkylation repair protein n=1 Tax=Lentisphaera profundi TaxID=1658616 RepID=A0ABY7VTA9_9BACT|nr:DNA alkylation repair protein [Lentisphaera profundi]WDE96994.1 DNA alkylation repair protein [Lentisphaera profundi]